MNGGGFRRIISHSEREESPSRLRFESLVLFHLGLQQLLLEACLESLIDESRVSRTLPRSLHVRVVVEFFAVFVVVVLAADFFYDFIFLFAVLRFPVELAH